MSTALDRDRLKLACHEVAHNTVCGNGPISARIVERYVEKLFHDAELHADYLNDVGCDPNIIITIVSYLSQRHAIPPLRDSMEWFREGLNILVELCCPNSIGCIDAEQLYREIEKGIQLARNDYPT